MINYGITEDGASGLARGLAREFGGCGVTVNAVLPGRPRTEGISTMLANESKRTASRCSSRAGVLLRGAPDFDSSSVLSPEPQRIAAMVAYAAAILRVPRPARPLGSKAAIVTGIG